MMWKFDFGQPRSCMVGLVLVLAATTCVGQSTVPVSPSDVLGGIQALQQGIESLLKGSGKNIRNVLAPLGCLDGGFSPDVSDDWSGTCLEVDTFCAFNVGYWETCPGNTPWQLWQLTEGKLWYHTGIKCFNAIRCIDAFDVRIRNEAPACGYSCWGGEGQELVAVFASKLLRRSNFDVVGEPVFHIKPRLLGDKCLTYRGTGGLVSFTPCSDSDNQLWFIPGELPQPIPGIEAPDSGQAAAAAVPEDNSGAAADASSGQQPDTSGADYNSDYSGP